MGQPMIKLAANLFLFFMMFSLPLQAEQSCKYVSFEKKGLYGFKDCNGKVKIKPLYDWAGKFHEGFCLVRSGREQRFIDKKGNFLKAHPFESALYFSEGLAPVKIEGKWGYIDSKGKLAIKPRYDDARTFRNGNALVSNTSKNGIKWGLIDKKGKLILDVQYDIKMIQDMIEKKYR